MKCEKVWLLLLPLSPGYISRTGSFPGRGKLGVQDIQTLTLRVKECVWTTGESSRESGCRAVMEVQENALCCIVGVRVPHIYLSGMTGFSQWVSGLGQRDSLTCKPGMVTILAKHVGL